MRYIIRAFAFATTAVTLGGCDDTRLTAPPNDTPAAGRPASPSPATRLIGPVYTGRASDSVLESVAARWAAAGRPEYSDRLRAIRAHRLTVLRSLEPPPITGGVETVDAYRQARILTHDSYIFYGGKLDPYNTVNSFVAGDMTFLGDAGAVSTSFSIVGNGVSYGPISGELAAGGGQLVDCADVIFSACSTHRLTGSMTLYNAPTCGVHAQGATTFQAWYAPAQISISGGGISVGPGGNREGLTSAAQDLSTASAPCPGPITTPEEQTDSTSAAAPGDMGAGGDMLGAEEGGGDDGYIVSTTACFENYELMRVTQDPYEWYYWQDMGTECGTVTGWVAMNRGPSGEAAGPLFSRGLTAPNGAAPGTTRSTHGKRRAILAASTRIPKGGHVAFVERGGDDDPDVVLVDVARGTVREVAAALSFGAARQGVGRTGDRAYVLAADHGTRYTERGRAVIQQSLDALRTAPVTDIPGFGKLPGVEIVLPPVIREP